MGTAKLPSTKCEGQNPTVEQTTKFQVIPALLDYTAAICHNTKVTHKNIFRGEGKYEIRCDDFKLLYYKLVPKNWDITPQLCS